MNEMKSVSKYNTFYQQNEENYEYKHKQIKQIKNQIKILQLQKDTISKLRQRYADIIDKASQFILLDLNESTETSTSINTDEISLSKALSKTKISSKTKTSGKTKLSLIEEELPLTPKLENSRSKSSSIMTNIEQHTVEHSSQHVNLKKKNDYYLTLLKLGSSLIKSLPVERELNELLSSAKQQMRQIRIDMDMQVQAEEGFHKGGITIEKRLQKAYQSKNANDSNDSSDSNDDSNYLAETKEYIEYMVDAMETSEVAKKSEIDIMIIKRYLAKYEVATQNVIVFDTATANQNDIMVNQNETKEKDTPP